MQTIATPFLVGKATPRYHIPSDTCPVAGLRDTAGSTFSRARDPPTGGGVAQWDNGTSGVVPHG